MAYRIIKGKKEKPSVINIRQPIGRSISRITNIFTYKATLKALMTLHVLYNHIGDDRGSRMLIKRSIETLQRKLEHAR